MLENEDLEAQLHAMGRSIAALELRNRRLENDDAIQNLMSGGIEWLGPSSIAVDELSALAILTGALTINDVLMLDGGRIEDAQGSIWDETGITFQLADSLTELIRFQRSGFSEEASIQGYIDTDETSLVFRADQAAFLDASIVIFAGAADEDCFVSLRGVADGAVAAFTVRGDGQFILQGLPTADPGIPGALYRTAGDVLVSI